ncbi:MAG: twin-arginine translocase TatA/TatE family subunit [Thermoleophilia bacterium]|nr:twin-arginine translocase TatA/TatE family subunit [Thermoleophilia bacterium]
MFDLSPIQLVIVLVIAVLVLGPSRLPQFSRAVGKGIRDFKAAINGHPGDESAAEQGATGTGSSVPTNPVTTATAGPPEHPTASPDVLDGIVVSGDAPLIER